MLCCIFSGYCFNASFKVNLMMRGNDKMKAMDAAGKTFNNMLFKCVTDFSGRILMKCYECFWFVLVIKTFFSEHIGKQFFMFMIIFDVFLQMMFERIMECKTMDVLMKVVDKCM